MPALFDLKKFPFDKRSNPRGNQYAADNLGRRQSGGSNLQLPSSLRTWMMFQIVLPMRSWCHAVTEGLEAFSRLPVSSTLRASAVAGIAAAVPLPPVEAKPAAPVGRRFLREWTSALLAGASVLPPLLWPRWSVLADKALSAQPFSPDSWRQSLHWLELPSCG